jgi:hypothetical protein
MTGPTDPVSQGGGTHPDELLAGYVEGSLTPAKRAEAERHLATCAACTDEVALARRARTGLSTLPELDVPVGLTRSVVDAARRGPSRLLRRPWVVGAAASAAAAAVVAVFAWSALHGGGSPIKSAAQTPAINRESGVAGAQPSSTAFPITTSSKNYDAASIQALAASIARRQGDMFSSVAPGPLPTPAAPVANPPSPTPLGATTKLVAPVPCVLHASSLGSTAGLVELIQARFQSTPVYIGVFAEPPLLSVWVVSRSDCQILNYTSTPISRR